MTATLDAPAVPRDTLVIGGAGMICGTRFYGRLPGSLSGLGRLVEPLGERPQVWLHESALGPLGLPTGPPGPSELHAGIFSETGSLVTKVSPRDWSSTYWYRRGGAGFDLHVPAWRPRDPRSPFAGLPDLRSLARAVESWSRATGGAPWRGAGTMTSDAWLRRYVKPTTNPPPLVEGQVRELQLDWWRRPDASETHMRYLHALDTNGAFLAVAGSLELPAGEPELVDFPPFDKRVPGVWHIECPEISGVLPPPWPAGVSDCWVTTPTMELAHQLGAEALEAWIWPTHGRYLRRWQERLRDARAELIAAGEWAGPAGQAVKAVYQQGPGRLASRRRAAEPAELDPLYQPYWDLAIIAESRCRIWRRARAAMIGTDCAPLAIYRDALFFLSSRDTPRRLAMALGLPVGGGLGQFKALGTVNAKVAREVLDRGLADTTSRLNRLVKERETPP